MKGSPKDEMVGWFLPDKRLTRGPNKGQLHQARRPFAYIAQAENYLLETVVHEMPDATWGEVRSALNFPGGESQVCDGFIDAGYRDSLARPCFVRRSADPADQLIALSPADLASFIAGVMPNLEATPFAERTIRLTLRDFAQLVDVAALYPKVMTH